MLLPSTEDMLDAWERGAAKGSVDRGLILATLAAPDAGGDMLAALPVGERDRHLLALRAAAFGPRLTGLLACDGCGEHLELDLNVDDLRAIPAPEAPKLAVTSGGYSVWFRRPNSHDLCAAAAAPGRASQRLLSLCVTQAEHEGAAISPVDLPPDLIWQIGDLLSAADPLADIRFALTCVQCGHACETHFDIAAFLWAELDAWGGRMQREVHTLASAYGWSERDILRLGPARRARYLQLVEA
jgi:hypothetical protein